MTTKRRAQRRVKTLNDLAAALGVSRTTVSNAFNRPDQLSQPLREKILDASRELGYPGPDPVARKLRTGRAWAIGVLFGDTLPYAFTDAAAIAFLRGIAQICELKHAGVLLLPAVDEPATGRMIREAAVDGFITYCLPDASPVTPYVLQRGLPAVSVEQWRTDGMSSVEIDDRNGAAAAARHVLELGHRQIAILSLDLRPDGHRGRVSAARRRHMSYGGTARRLQGYESALEEAGIDSASVPVFECPGNDRELACAYVAAMLRQRRPPTALLAMSDELALGAIQAAREHGVEVPQQLSVIGFDDAPAASLWRPGLTTVRQPLTEKGRLAAETLFRLAEEPTAAAEHHHLETQLVIRDTTAPPPERR
jgi:DNA-binding LacI/PurR family transcriptional regulator